MDKQAIFNRVVEGLALQGFQRSLNEEPHVTQCRYRGMGGRKCAIGFLIPDSAYYPELEGNGPYNQQLVVALRAGGIDYLPERDAQFLYELRSAHDDGEAPRVMKANLRAVAVYYKLELPEALR